MQIGVEHDFLHHWIGSVSYTWGNDWGVLRSSNINAPLVVSSIGTAPDPAAALMAPRPILPNENIMQYQNSGHSIGSVHKATLQQYSTKRFNLAVGSWYSEFRSDGGWDGAATPQSNYSNKGEFSRPDMMLSGAYVSNDTKLPEKIDLAIQIYV